MLISTGAIVIKTIKYGDTSLIGYVFTEALGLQTVMLKGVRSSRNKNGSAGMWQSGSILDIVLYHHPQKNFQLIKEYKPAYIFKNIPENIVRQCVSVFTMEVMSLYLQKDNKQEDLFCFVKKYLQALDEMPVNLIGNMPLFFLINCGKLNGYIISGSYTETTCIVNLQEGKFTGGLNIQPPFIEGEEARVLSNLLYENDIYRFAQCPLTRSQRNSLLYYLLQFMELHIPGFKPVKSLPVISAVLN